MPSFPENQFVPMYDTSQSLAQIDCAANLNGLEVASCEGYGWLKEARPLTSLVRPVFRNIETEDQNFDPNFGIESLGSVIVLIAFTDLAFSLDSMTTAIALADRFWILLTGGILGMLALRFLTGLFVRWLAEFVYLQDAAYLTVLAVGGRLLLKACQPTYLPPEWMVLMMVAISLSWGFSKRVVVE